MKHCRIARARLQSGTARLDGRTLTLIGGCGSSGTTLLAAILGAHPGIVCGPEMSFLNKRVLYTDFPTFRARLGKWLRRGVVNDGYFSNPELFPSREHYGITDRQLVSWAQISGTTQQFVRLIESWVLQEEPRGQWVEKTPTNVYCFRDFARAFPTGRIVHVVRDGRDVVCSLRQRGFSMFQAASRWVYDASAGLSCRDLPQYLEVPYEDLVASPVRCLERICAHIGVPFVASMLDRQSGGPPPCEALPSWRSSPTNSPINAGSVGRYRYELNGTDLGVFYSLRLTRYSARKLRFKPIAAVELLEALGYPAPSSGLGACPLPVAMKAARDEVRRMLAAPKHHRRFRPPLTCIRWP